MKQLMLGVLGVLGLVGGVLAEDASGDGEFRLRNVNSGLCLVSRGGPEETAALQVYCDEEFADQYWYYSVCTESPCADFGKPTQIVNAETGRCLIARRGGNVTEDRVVTGGCDDSFSDQLWKVQLLNARSFVLVNAYTGKRLLVRGYAPESEALTTWVSRDFTDQHWTEEDHR